MAARSDTVDHERLPPDVLGRAHGQVDVDPRHHEVGGQDHTAGVARGDCGRVVADAEVTGHQAVTGPPANRSRSRPIRANSSTAPARPGTIRIGSVHTTCLALSPARPHYYRWAVPRATTRTPTRGRRPRRATGQPRRKNQPMPPTEHKKLIAWVDEVAALTEPAEVVWCDGSAEEYDRMCQLLVDNGTFTRLVGRQAARTATGPTPTRATSPGSRTGPTSAPPTRPTPAPPTTGGTRPRCGTC